MESADVVVVGARCAGAAVARLLARRGLDVVVLDRSRRGTDKMSTLYIHQPGVAYLRDWGLLDDVLAPGVPAIRELYYRVEDVVLRGCGPWVGGGSVAYAPRRSHLDEVLVQGAEAAGASVRHEATVTEVVVGAGGRVAGVRYRRRGQGFEVSAPLVVGADGMRSLIAREVVAEAYRVNERLSCCYYAFWQGLQASFGQYQADGLWVGVIPTMEDQHLVACYFRQAEFVDVRRDIAAAYRRGIERAAPEIAGRLDAAEQVGRFIATGDQQNFFRAPAGPGWALVGDAAHHKDSLTARGITDAFIQAALLDEAVGEAGSLAAESLDPMLARYAERLDAAMLPFYGATLAVARLDVDAERLSELREISESRWASDQYAAAVAGAITAEECRRRLAAGPEAAQEPFNGQPRQQELLGRTSAP